MHYRRFPLIEDREVSALGFGCMRLPTIGGDAGVIDEAAFDAALVAAAEAGISYLDTAYPYHKGMSEVALGAALDRTGLRGRFTLATKSPTWLVNEAADWDRYLAEQLKRLRTEHLDFYLLHALSAERWEKVKRLGGIEALERARADGRIGHIGFSFHDSLSAFKTIVDGYQGWEFCQVQFNYVDLDFQAGAAGIEYAAARDIGVIVMEPLRGGGLVRAPADVLDEFRKYPVPRTPAEWALRFALDRQEVVTVLSGMGSAEQVLQNSAVAASARPNSLTRDERAILAEARRLFKARERVGCSTCGYCQPCPSKVAIPEVFSIYNTAVMFDDRKARSAWYAMANVKSGTGADACTQCGACLAKCPQSIAIPDKLAEAHAYLTGSA